MRSYGRCLPTVYRTEKKKGREFYKEIKATTKKKIVAGPKYHYILSEVN
jgi:hypothetical protein